TQETAWTPGKPDAKPNGRPRPREYSICTAAALAQDQLEPMLRTHALELGADIRLSTTLVAFEQDAEGISATLRHRDGREYTLRAHYMIGADGHASPAREALGIS